MDIEVLGISRKMLKSKMLREQVKQCSQFLDFTYNQKHSRLKSISHSTIFSLSVYSNSSCMGLNFDGWILGI